MSEILLCLLNNKLLLFKDICLFKDDVYFISYVILFYIDVFLSWTSVTGTSSKKNQKKQGPAVLFLMSVHREDAF